MKILITGANGYIGSKVTTKLIEMGHDVVAIDCRKENIDTRANVILDDIFSNKDFYSIAGSPDVCLHLAWRDGFVHNSTAHMEDLSKHFTFLKNMIDSGLKQIAIMGTMHEAGYYEGMMSNLTLTNPLSLYGIAKDSLRRSMQVYCTNKPITFQWLRAFYIYGNDDFGNSIFCKIRKAFKEGKKSFPFTTGKNEFDFIHIDELVEQISLAVTQSEISGEINVCSGKPVSLAEQVEKYISINKIDIKLDYGAYPDRPYDSPCVYGDSKKIRTIINNKKR